MPAAAIERLVSYEELHKGVYFKGGYGRQYTMAKKGLRFLRVPSRPRT